MTGLVPADNPGAGMLTPLTGGSGSFGERLRAVTAQPSARNVLPGFAGTAGPVLLPLTSPPLYPAPPRAR